MFSHVPQRKQTVSSFLSFLLLLVLGLFVSLLIFRASSSLPSVCCCCVIVFIRSSSGASTMFSSSSLSRCVTICSYEPFPKYAWFIDFFRYGGNLAYTNCSMISCAATPKAFTAKFWSSSKKSITFWFAGSKASR